jgi:hypothetical protein
MLKRTMPILIASILLTFQPLPAGAQPLARTAFVPELATPAVGLFALRHLDDLYGTDLTRSAIGVRFEYVPYPAIQVTVDLFHAEYELELPGSDVSESGLGMQIGGKYQLANLVADFDTSVAASLQFSSSDNVTEMGTEVMGLISRTFANNWTPFAALGIAFDRQEYDDGISLEESRLDPVVSLGVTYNLAQKLLLEAGTFFKDGLGLETMVSYRF